MSEPSLAVFHRQTLANRVLLVLAATRPAFLTASVLPVLAAGALAAGGGTPVSGSLLALVSLNIALIHCGANVLNDYFDALNGSDALNVDRIYPFSGGSRFIQNGVLSVSETRTLGATLLGLGAMLGFYLAWLTGPLLLAIGLAGGLIAFHYSAPPCLVCRGLGDAAIAICFGILPVAGTTLILTGEVTAASLWLGASIGCFVAAILWANSIPDTAADRAAGKYTLPARLGPAAAARALPLWFVSGFLLLAVAPLPAAAWAALTAVVPAGLATKAALDGRLPAALPLTIMTHAAFCVLLIAGLMVSRV